MMSTDVDVLAEKSEVKPVSEQAFNWEKYWQSGQYDVSFPFENVVGFIFRHCKGASKILDVGCGNGNNFPPILKIGATPVGIDCSKSALTSAKAKFSNSELHQVDFNQSWPIESNSIDHAFDRASLTCTRKETIVFGLSEIHRVLKKGGYFKWIVLSDDSDFCRLGTMDDDGFVTQSDVDDVPTGQRFRGYTFVSFKELQSLLKSFTIVDLSKSIREEYKKDGLRRQQCFYEIVCQK